VAKFVFPSWKGWLLINPVRLLLQPPDKILGDLAAPGMTVLDLGCSMGYFTLPLARRIGPHGRVLCLDSDETQLRVLRRRAARAGLLDRLELRLLDPTVSDLSLAPQSLDLAVLLQVLHYMDDPPGALAQTHAALKPGAALLLGEPRSHLSPADWRATLDMAAQAGFAVGDTREMYNLRLAIAKK